ncbi:transient receptor potential channel pyrexia-like isoform X2 [Palaemon carinicauda]|uniref:transient receptor potential channel pyrexia-like isoform X2 n=1 Tax=Palaemon carinicauda TaxID=392227 RepID=UPI0035B5F6C4
MPFWQGHSDKNSSANAPLMTVTSSNTYHAEMMEALEQGDAVALKSALDHLTPLEVNGCFTHSADEVFSVESVELPPLIRDDLSQQDIVTIYPVHYAAMMGWKEILGILLKAEADPNVKDSLGQTPLHILPKGDWRSDQNFQDCLDLLLAHPKIDVNRLDLSKSTPLHRAELHGWSYMVNRLREIGPTDNSTLSHTTSTDMLLKEMIDGNLKAFQSTLATIQNSGLEMQVTLDENHGSYTLLQLACRSGLYDFVVELLNKRASPIKKYNSNLSSPVLWLTKYGYHRSLQLLVRSMTLEHLRDGALKECNQVGETPLHLSVMCSNPQDSDPVNGYHCLEILLEKKQYINIDQTNCDGNTALHFAALCDDAKAYSILLKNGANSTALNAFGACAMQYISKEGMLQILDSCIEFDEKKKMIDKDYWIKINYEMMRTSTDHENCETKEMTFLNSLANVFQDKDILEHPLINIFVFLKWMKIKKFFHLNSAFHVIFLMLLITYISIFHSSLEIPENENSIQNNDALRMTLAALLLLAIFLREVSQLFMMKTLREYITEAKNITEIITVILVVLLICMPFNSRIKMDLAAWLVIFSLLEFIFHLGQRRLCAVYITMFKAVAWNFLKFICLFFLFILAFSFSFYLMFQASEDFKTFPESLLKTIIMTTGEMEYSDLPLSSFPVTTHFLMVLFVFLILLVIVNLLNGLAISDIQAIQHRSEVISIMSHVDRMTQLEKAFSVDSSHNPFRKIFTCLFSDTLIMKSKNGCLPNAHLVVYISQNDFMYKYKTKDSIRSSICECHKYKLEDCHINALRGVVMEKKRVTFQK